MSKVENLIFDPRLGHPDLPEASLGATCSRLNINALNSALLLNLLSFCETLLHAVQTFDTVSLCAHLRPENCEHACSQSQKAVAPGWVPPPWSGEVIQSING